MGYKGGSRAKIGDRVGIDSLEVLTSRKRPRCAASVYSRHEPDLRSRGERILREELGSEVVLKWPTGEKPKAEAKTEAMARDPMEVIGFTDGSRMEGVSAVATAEDGLYLGELAMVMEQTCLGLWERGKRVTTRSPQTARQRSRGA